MSEHKTRFRDARNRAGLSLRKLEEASGIPYSVLFHLEKREMGVSYLSVIKLAEFYGISVDWLLGLTDCRTPDAFDMLPEQTRANLKAILNSPKRDKLLRLCAEVLSDEHQ